MNTLHRYLLRNHLLYVLLCLGAALGIYLMIDVFDRMDDFIASGQGLGTMGEYFLTKLPSIVAQILPAVFLLSLLIQLGLMRRSRELTALETSGIAFYRLGVFFLVCGLAWCVLQLVFSQVLGVAGEARSEEIWDYQVRQRQEHSGVIKNVWFKEGRHILHLDLVLPGRGEGGGITVYVMASSFEGIERVITAEAFSTGEQGWVLKQAREFEPQRFATRELDQLVLPLELDPGSFLAVDPRSKPESLPLWKLRSFIDQLESAGSNVERLLTAYHMRWAYAFSIPVMVLVALALTSLIGGIYLKVTAGLAVTFAYYGVFVMGGTLGENNVLSPWLGAWLGNLVFCAAALIRLAWIFRPRGARTNVAVVT
ncbi:MAG: LptF/LptG family permease [Desulfohalobiaceae bacterium]